MSYFKTILSPEKFDTNISQLINMKYKKLKKQIEKAINRNGIDAKLSTPDWLLADLLIRTLKNFQHINKVQHTNRIGFKTKK